MLGLGTSFDMEHMMILNGGANMGFYSGGYLFFLCGSSNKKLRRVKNTTKVHRVVV